MTNEYTKTTLPPPSHFAPHVATDQSLQATASSVLTALSQAANPATSAQNQSQTIADECSPNSEGPKHDSAKPNWSYFPFLEAELVLQCFEHGVSKYRAPFTYRAPHCISHPRLFSAAIRHLIQSQYEDTDCESSCLHWAHVAATALMALSHFTDMKKKRSKIDFSDGHAWCCTNPECCGECWVEAENAKKAFMR